MAVLAHALQMVGMFIAPLVIFVMKRQSRFVSFHALQALIFQLIYVVVIFVIIVALMTTVVLTVPNLPSSSQTQNSVPPLALFLLVPLIWLGMMGLGVAGLLLAILYSIKAGKGEWAAYPVIGCFARKILKIGPDGAPLPMS